jgi:hypothetical protein
VAKNDAELSTTGLLAAKCPLRSRSGSITFGAASLMPSLPAQCQIQRSVLVPLGKPANPMARSQGSATRLTCSG